MVLGGTEYVGDWNTEASMSDRKKIWDMCTKYVPSLTVSHILNVLNHKYIPSHLVDQNGTKFYCN